MVEAGSAAFKYPKGIPAGLVRDRAATCMVIAWGSTLIGIGYGA